MNASMNLFELAENAQALYDRRAFLDEMASALKRAQAEWSGDDPNERTMLIYHATMVREEQERNARLIAAWEVVREVVRKSAAAS